MSYAKNDAIAHQLPASRTVTKLDSKKIITTTTPGTMSLTQSPLPLKKYVFGGVKSTNVLLRKQILKKRAADYYDDYNHNEESPSKHKKDNNGHKASIVAGPKISTSDDKVVTTSAGRVVAPFKYTKTQCKLDFTAAKKLLEAHFKTLSFTINKKKAYGVEKLTVSRSSRCREAHGVEKLTVVNYFSIMSNKDFLANLRRTNTIGRSRIITIATELFKSRLAVAEMKDKCCVDYSTFVRQYIDAVARLPCENFSAAYIKRVVEDATTIFETVASSVSPRQLSSEFKVPEKCDYRLIWPALVFQLGWTHKDYKTKDGSGAVCFTAAGYILEAILNNIAFNHHILVS